MERHILAIFPHPDDETFSSGGFISSQTSQGVPVTYICATYGEMGRNMGKNLHTNRETTKEIRKKELRDACDILGIEDIHYLDYRDKTLEFEDIEEVSARIKEIIEKVKPSLILTFYPGQAVHPDHDACGAAVIHAVSQIASEERPTVYAVAITKDREKLLGKPDVTLDVAAFSENKLNAIKAHASQTEAMLAAMGAPDLSKKWLSEEQFYTYKF